MLVLQCYSVATVDWHMQGVDFSLTQSLAVGATGRSLKQGSSFRSRPQTGQSGDGSESQAGVEGMDEHRVDCWNGGYIEAKSQSADLREQQTGWRTTSRCCMNYR